MEAAPATGTGAVPIACLFVKGRPVASKQVARLNAPVGTPLPSTTNAEEVPGAPLACMPHPAAIAASLQSEIKAIS